MFQLCTKDTLWLVTVMLLSACMSNSQPPKFYLGQMVRSVVSGNVGQVVGSVTCHSYPCMYSVRFPALQITTNTHLLAHDSPVSFGVLSIEWMREYELEAVEIK